MFKFQSGSCVLINDTYQNLGILDKSVDLFLTSPPYNIGSGGERKDGFRCVGKFDPKSFGGIRGYADTLPEKDYQESQLRFLEFCFTHLKDNGVVAYNHKDRHKKGGIISPLEWIKKSSFIIHDIIVLNRESTHNQEISFSCPIHEYLFILKKSCKEKIYYNKSRTEDFKNISTIWRFPIQKIKDKNRHCAPFDLKFARECIFRWCFPGGIVCDPYSGSGTTMLAAYLEGRKFVGSELQKNYYKQSIERFSKVLND